MTNELFSAAAEYEAAILVVLMIEASDGDPSDFIEQVAGPAELRWLAAVESIGFEI